MNFQSRVILQRILVLINDYKNNKINLKRLVDSLEGSLNSIEEKIPDEFTKLWYLHWGNLEIILALGIEIQSKEEILNELEKLEKIIQDYLLV